MMVSTRGRYALSMMVDLAENQGDGFVALKDITERQAISKKYMEQIVPALSRAGLLQTSRGSAGGYRLVKAPSEYTIGEILRVTEGNMAPVSCMESAVNTCPHCTQCATLPIWAGLQKVMDEYLDSYTLQNILDNKSASGGGVVI